uniref:STAS domain-containing protein n=1 Tax=Plectus sambesii TaxID=2011161 RepID=A0A914WW38_9BILA
MVASTEGFTEDLNGNDAEVSISRLAYNQEQFDVKFGLLPVDRRALREKVRSAINRCCAPYTTAKGILTTIINFIPILQWLPKYKWREDSSHDIVAGLTIGIMNIPQGMAYAALASVPPVYGLYTSFFAPLLYMIFGTSRHVSMGVFSVVSLMVGTARLRILPDQAIVGSSLANGTAPTGSVLAEYSPIEVVTTLTLAVGLVQLAMALLRLDFLTAYLSDQVVSGFSTGAACHLFAVQLNEMMGVKLPRYDGFFRLYYVLHDLATAIPQSNLAAVIVSICSIAFLVVGKEVINPLFKKKCPIPLPFDLFLLIIATVVSHAGQFKYKYKMKVVDHIPTGIPSLSLPHFDLLPTVFRDAVEIAIVSFVVTISMGKLFAKRHRYRIDSSQELYAMGITSAVSSLFPVFPATTSLSRSLVCEAAGTKTQLNTVLSSGLLLVVILWLGPLLEPLPMCVLACIILVALKGLFMQVSELKPLWRLSKIDCIVWIFSCVITMCSDVMEGLALSVAFVMLTVVLRSQWPQSHWLGQLPDTMLYRDVAQYDSAVEVAGIRVVRFDSPLLFNNVELFKRVVHKAARHFKLDHAGYDNNDAEIAQNDPSVKKKSTAVRRLVIDCSGFTFIDCMGVQALKEVSAEMDAHGVTVAFACAKAPVCQLFEASGFYKSVPKRMFYPTIHNAVIASMINEQSQDGFKFDLQH